LKHLEKLDIPLITSQSKEFIAWLTSDTSTIG
jgi:hypothetical protein